MLDSRHFNTKSQRAARKTYKNYKSLKKNSKGLVLTNLLDLSNINYFLPIVVLMYNYHYLLY